MEEIREFRNFSKNLKSKFKDELKHEEEAKKQLLEQEIQKQKAIENQNR